MNIFTIASALGASPWLLLKLLLRLSVAVTAALSPIGTTRKVKLSGGKVQFRLDCGTFRVQFGIRNLALSPSPSRRSTPRQGESSPPLTGEVDSTSTGTVSELPGLPVPGASFSTEWPVNASRVSGSPAAPAS